MVLRFWERELELVVGVGVMVRGGGGGGGGGWRRKTEEDIGKREKWGWEGPWEREGGGLGGEKVGG